MKRYLSLLLVLLAFSCRESPETTATEKALDSLYQENQKLKTERDSLFQAQTKNTGYSSFFDTIPNPEIYVLEEMNEESEKLIPKDPVLGGTMRFVDVEFLNHHLLIAEYEDGHIMGRSVYAYSADQQGNLQFRHVGDLRLPGP